jgi:small subunit ribosomal protein S6
LKTAAKKVYEAMFLVDSVQAATDWEGTNSLIKTILEKAEAQIISIRKWDERKLAYDIAKKSRGAYILCYFNAPTSKITQIERDVQLSEKIMRVLILRGDHLTKEDMEKETPIAIMERQGTSPQAEPEQQAEQGYQKRYKKVEQLDQAPEPVKEAKIEDNPQPAAGGDTTT